MRILTLMVLTFLRLSFYERLITQLLPESSDHINIEAIYTIYTMPEASVECKQRKRTSRRGQKCCREHHKKGHAVA
jgi:hypothetical protein